MHISVLLKETIENLNIRENLVYVDCTLGYAGHSREVLKRINKGLLFAFDQDIEAIEYSKKELSKISNQFEIIKSNFVNLKKELNQRGIVKVDGIIFDLGVSSPQLDNGERGFSYQHNALLDMRMDTSNKLSAYEVVNEYPEEKITNILFHFGEEKYARSIARGIIKARNIKPIKTTYELVDVIKTCVPEKYKRETHPAKRTFQAIRIEVNKELEILEESLEDAIDMLNPKGRICVITFHSLEDRICKQTFKKYSDIDPLIKRLPIMPEGYQPKLKIIGKFNPTEKEVLDNNRSRSATLRVAEKL